MNTEMKQAGIAAAFFVLALIVGFVLVNDARTQRDELTSQNEALQQEIDSLKAKAARLPKLREQLEKIEANLSQYIQILPSPEVATQERLMELVQEKAERAQFRPEQYGMEQGGDGGGGRRGRRSAKAFQEISLTIDSTATFNQFLRFLNALERHQTFLRVNSFSCSANQRQLDTEGEPVWPLSISLNISTFRYQAGK